MERSSAFVIKVHPRDRIVEVTYPSHPTVESYDQYDRELRAVVEPLGAGWRCLVDQRALTVAPQEISERIAALNAWAIQHGMTMSVRVVKESAVAELQARRILRESGLKDTGTVFHSREEAWRALAVASR